MPRHEMLQQLEPDARPPSPYQPRPLIPLLIGVGAFVGSMLGQSADEAPPLKRIGSLQAKRPTVSSPKPSLSRTEQAYGGGSERWKKAIGNQRTYPEKKRQGK